MTDFANATGPPVAFGTDLGTEIPAQSSAVRAADGQEGAPKQSSTMSMGATSMLNKQRSRFLVGWTKAEQPLTRHELLEYVNLQRWSRIACQAWPLPMFLWIVFLMQISAHMHTDQSYHISTSMVDSIHNITADLTRGVPPDRVFSLNIPTGSKCTCACAVERTEALCQTTGNRNKRLQGLISLEELALLRARADYNTTEVADTQPMKWDNILTIADVWFWIQHGLLPFIWKEAPRNDPVEMQSFFPDAGEPRAEALARSASVLNEPGLLLRWNQAIRGVRMRTRRNYETACSTEGSIAEIYGSRCHTEEPAVEPFGPGLQAYTDGFMPREDEPGAFDVHLDLDHPIRKATEKVQYMLKSHRWLDSATSEMYIQIPFLNAEAMQPLFGLLEVRFDFERSGGMRRSIKVRTVAATHYRNKWQIGLDIAWGVIVLGFILRMIYRVKDCRCSCNMILLMDVIMLLMSCGLAVNRAVLISATKDTVEQVSGLPAAPSVEATPEELQAYHSAWDASLDRIRFLVVRSEWDRLSYFWYALMLTGQFLQVFRGQPKLAKLARVLTHASEDLLHFLFLFSALFLNFAFGGFLIFGLSLDGWSTGWRAINTSFQIFVGKVDVVEMYALAPISTVFWYFLFVTTLIFLLLNLLLAIAYESYMQVQEHVGNNTGLFRQTWDLACDQHSRGWLSLCGCRRRGQSPPSHRFIAKHLMSQSLYNDEERRSIEASCIGAEWTHSGLEKAAFAVEEKEARAELALRAAQGNAQQDLDDLSVDPEYAQSLVKRCQQHLKREHDMTRQKEAQLRELVMLCEADMLCMREKLAQTQEYSGDSITYLIKRFEELEHAVHYSLEELVSLADGAGISSKGRQGPTPEKRAQLDITVGSLRSFNDPKSSSLKSAAMMTGAWKGVFSHLSTNEEKFKDKVPQKAKTEAGKDLHRAFKMISPKGKRTTRSAREDWVDK